MCVCVYVCACSLLYGCYIPAGFLPGRLALSPGCGALPLPLSSNVTGRLPSTCSTLPLSLSLSTSPVDCRLLAFLKRSRTLSCYFRRWASARALSLARSAASSVWCCCSCVHSARDAAIARKSLTLGLRARSTWCASMPRKVLCLWLDLRSGAAASPILCILFCVWISNFLSSS